MLVLDKELFSALFGLFSTYSGRWHNASARVSFVVLCHLVSVRLPCG